MATEQDEKNAPTISVEEENDEQQQQPQKVVKENGINEIQKPEQKEAKEVVKDGDKQQVVIGEEAEKKTKINDIKKSQDHAEAEEELAEIILEEEEDGNEDEEEEEEQTEVKREKKIIEEVKEVEAKIVEKEIKPDSSKTPESGVKIDAENTVTENVKSSAPTTTNTNDNNMNEQSDAKGAVSTVTITTTTTTKMADVELPKLKEHQPQQLPITETTTIATQSKTSEEVQKKVEHIIQVKGEEEEEKELKDEVDKSKSQQQQQEEIEINVRKSLAEEDNKEKVEEKKENLYKRENENKNNNSNNKDCVDATERYSHQQFPLAMTTKTAYGKINWNTPTTNLPYQQQQQYVPPQQQQEKQQQQQQQQQQQYVPQQQTSSSYYENEESSNLSKNVDLQKIFTPATDANFISPNNRKLYASSAFYSPSLHPTVEDQVELARRISHSLSDISNQQSKGQSMYVNRKKRSVKWIHEGGQEFNVEERDVEGKEETAGGTTAGEEEESKENSTGKQYEKLPLKLIMNPRGQVRDIFSLKETINTQGLLSPEKCHELVMALQEHKGRGAELFAKRRKKAENWIVEATTTRSASTINPSSSTSSNISKNELSVEIEKNLSSNEIADYQQQQQQYGGQQYRPSTSPNLLPAYSDVGKHRVQLNLQQEQLLQKYVKPELRVVKTPWEAALETGSASTAFVEKTFPMGSPSSLSTTPTQQQQQQQTRSVTPTPYYQKQQQQQSDNIYNNDNDLISGGRKYHLPKVEKQQPQFQANNNNYQRDLAYKPNVPQGWKSSTVNLPSVVDLKLQQVEHERKCDKISKDMREKSGETEYEKFLKFENNKNNNYNNNNNNDKKNNNNDKKNYNQSKIVYEHQVEHEERNFNNLSTRQQQQEERRQQVENSVFIEHFVRSPELRLSPIPMNNLWAYDKTVQQLNQIQQQEQHKQQHQYRPLIHQEEHIDLLANEIEQQMRQQDEDKSLIAAELKYEKQQQRQQESNENIKKKLQEQQQHEKTKEKQMREENEVEEYVKIAVGDLINAFERHAKVQKEKLQRQQQQHNKICHIGNEKNENISCEKYHQQQQQPFSYEAYYEQQKIYNNNNNKNLEENPADLFKPKEIPLESYAPPPAMPAVLTKPLSLPYGQQKINNNKSMGTWSPLTHIENVNNWETPKYEQRPQPLQQQQQPPYNYYQQQEQLKQDLPKQQYLPETSYQRVVKPMHPHGAPVNFSPSPLAQQKLAKFEDPTRNWSPNNNKSQSRYIGSPSGGYAAAPSSIDSPTLQYAASPPNQYQRAQTPSKSLRIISDNAQNFNNAARGWQKPPPQQHYQHQVPNCAYGYGYGYANAAKPTIHMQKAGWADDSSLPYTDF